MQSRELLEGLFAKLSCPAGRSPFPEASGDASLRPQYFESAPETDVGRRHPTPPLGTIDIVHRIEIRRGGKGASPDSPDASLRILRMLRRAIIQQRLSNQRFT